MLSRVGRAQHAVHSFACRGSLLHPRWSSTATSKTHDPLRILFCGADEFSIYSLRALRDLQQTRADKIRSIDVVCRPDKRVGRGLKQIQEVPIKRVAQDLGLNLHQIDTFKDWSCPPSINLVIAVSFGLLVPARILNGAKYGGLNVHPSLLPDLRGPAPIQHTLLKRRSHAGVTVQTMHPTKFDHGLLLAQTPEPGVKVERDCTPAKLIETLGPLGAAMLCKSIEDGLFVPPVQDLGVELPMKTASHAPKITPQDRMVDWGTWTSEDIIVRDRVLGRLWDATTYARSLQGTSNGGSTKRVTFRGPWKKLSESLRPFDNTSNVGYPVLVSTPYGDAEFGILASNGYVVIPAAATIEGERRDQGLATLRNGLRRMSQSPAQDSERSRT